MVAVSEFVQYIHPDIHQVTTALLTSRLGSVLSDFCERTKILQIEMDPISLIPAVKEIEIPTPLGTKLVEVRRLTYKTNRTDLTAATIDYLDRTEADWRTKVGEPCKFCHVNKNTIRVTPHPDKVEPVAVTGRIAVKPSRTATVVDDLLFDDYAETIAAGTKAALMTMPSKPWTSPGDAQVFAMQYAEGVERAKAQAENSHSSRVRRRTKPYY